MTKDGLVSEAPEAADADSPRAWPDHRALRAAREPIARKIASRCRLEPNPIGLRGGSVFGKGLPTPVIVSSGGLDEKPGPDAIDALEALGVRHILHKPHGAHVLLEALEESIEGGMKAGSGPGIS